MGCVCVWCEVSDGEFVGGCVAEYVVECVCVHVWDMWCEQWGMCVWCKWWGVCETGHVVRVCVCVCVCDMSGAVCLCDVYVRGLHMGGDPPAALGRSPSGQVPSPHPQSGPSGHTEHTEL